MLTGLGLCSPLLAAAKQGAEFRWLPTMFVAWAATGCVTISRHPVDEQVIQSRQLSLRGIDAAQRGHWADAEKLFATAIELHPSDPLSHQRYSESLWHGGQLAAALQHMETAARLSGDEPPLVIQLGQMYLASGRVGEAAAEAERAVMLASGLPEAWALRGDVLRELNRPIDAMTSYHRALAIQPQQPKVQAALCQLYLELDRPRRALATIDSLAGTFPPDAIPPDVLAYKGISLKRLGRYPSAIEVLSQAVQATEPTPDLLLELAEAHLLAGDASSARWVAQNIPAPALGTPRFRDLFDQIQLAANTGDGARRE